MKKKPRTFTMVFRKRWFTMMTGFIIGALMIATIAQFVPADQTETQMDPPEMAEVQTFTDADREIARQILAGEAKGNTVANDATTKDHEAAKAAAAAIVAARYQDSDKTDSTPEEGSETVRRKTQTEINYELNQKASKIYYYGSVSEIPATLPEDCGTLQFYIKEDCSYGFGQRDLAGFWNRTLGYGFEITVPYVEGLTEEAEAYGYSMIGVWFYNAKKDVASFNVFVFNPEENPTIRITMRAGETNTFWAFMDAQVADFDVFVRARLDEVSVPSVFDDPDAEVSGVWQSSGVSYSGHLYYGGGTSGCPDYMVSAYRVLMMDGVTLEKSHYLRYAIESVAKYKEYWRKHSSYTFTTRSYFSDDRTWFNADEFAKAHGCTVLGSGKEYRRYLLPDGKTLIVNVFLRQGDRFLEFDRATQILIDGKECSYARGEGLRINGVRDTTTMSGNIALSRDQLSALLAFLTGTVEIWY